MTNPDPFGQNLEDEMAAKLAHAAKVCASVDTFTLYNEFWRASNAVCRVEISGRADDKFGPHVTFYASRGDMKFEHVTCLGLIATFGPVIEVFARDLGRKVAAEFDAQIEYRQRAMDARNYPPPEHQP